ncbi:site-specific integrase [Desulfobacula sp.]|uniref:tyrosine-type recombinase/integrase n=1 Tax=Desulfobacula sp. TaxID=2593537 RepID=UPI0026381974|nr:site-specific integrase [Desulfobacula sp.]
MSSNKKVNWIQVDKKHFPGVRYYKHETRKKGVKLDRYFSGSYQVQGKRKFMGFGWSSEGWTERKVLDKINEYKHNVKTGNGPTTLKEEIVLKEAEKAKIKRVAQKKERESLTIDDYFYQEYYPMIQRQKKSKTYLREESLYRNWIKENIGHRPFNEITKVNIETIYYDIVESGKSIRTAEYTLTTLKQIWREAKERGCAPDMPIISKALKKKISQNNNARIRFLSQKEADILLFELGKKSIDLYEKSLISLHCGLRAGEIFNLTWSQVDLEHGILNIIDSKGKDRSVHMSELVKEMMLSKDRVAAHNLVYPGREGKASKQISQVFRQVANELFNKRIDDRRERVTFHTLRHTCASWMVMQGISLYLVQKVLGHSTIQVTERYSHLAPDQLQLAAGAINKAVAENKGKNIIPFPKQA